MAGMWLVLFLGLLGLMVGVLCLVGVGVIILIGVCGVRLPVFWGSVVVVFSLLLRFLAGFLAG